MGGKTFSEIASGGPLCSRGAVSFLGGGWQWLGGKHPRPQPKTQIFVYLGFFVWKGGDGGGLGGTWGGFHHGTPQTSWDPPQGGGWAGGKFPTIRHDQGPNLAGLVFVAHPPNFLVTGFAASSERFSNSDFAQKRRGTPGVPAHWGPLFWGGFWHGIRYRLTVPGPCGWGGLINSIPVFLGNFAAKINQKKS